MTKPVQDRKRRHTDPISLIQSEDQVRWDKIGKIRKYLDLADQLFSTDEALGID